MGQPGSLSGRTINTEEVDSILSLEDSQQKHNPPSILCSGKSPQTEELCGYIHGGKEFDMIS